MSIAALARTAAPLALSPRLRPQRADGVQAALPGQPAPATNPPRARADGFDTLAKYIPTETVTIFVAICSGRSAIETIAGRFSYPAAYVACALLTPALMWLIAMGRHRSAGEKGLARLHWWPPLAATVAFLVWALSVPGTTSMFTGDLAKQNAWGVLAGIGAVLVSLLLSMLEPVFGPRVTDKG